MSKRKLSPAKRRLLIEMADTRTVILIQPHPRLWAGLRYSVTSFPMRRLRTTMVAELIHDGYIEANTRGQLVLTLKGTLIASILEHTIKTREELKCLRS
jgi:hypothetical protein